MRLEKIKERWEIYFENFEGDDEDVCSYPLYKSELEQVMKLIAVAEAAKDALDCCDPMFRATERLEKALADLEGE